MKRQVIHAAIAFSGPMMAQGFIDPAHTWNVVLCVNFGACETWYYRFNGDTIIDGMTYSKLYVSWYPTMANADYECAFREDSNTAVYINDGDGEYLSHRMDVEVGDTVVYGPLCGPPLVRVVYAVDSVQLSDGQVRRRVKFQWGSEEWIQGVGTTFGPTGQEIAFCTTDLFTRLNCFSDSALTLYDDATLPGCDYSTVAVDDVSEPSALGVVPVPFTTGATITVPDCSTGTVELYDLFGKVALSATGNFSNGLLVSTEALAAGTYIAKCTCASHRTTVVPVVKQ